MLFRSSPEVRGISAGSGNYRLIVKLKDKNGKEVVRNRDFSTSLSDDFWFIDFAQTGGDFANEGLALFGEDKFSFILNQFLPSDTTISWDFRLNLDDPTNPLIQVNSNRLIRRVVEEGLFEDAQSTGHVITTNGLSNQEKESQLVNTTLGAERGGLYLIKIGADERKLAGGNNGQTEDAYVLMKVDGINITDQKLEIGRAHV